MIFVVIRQVELVGGGSWWSRNFGSLVIGLAAIVGAGIAAYISVRNHKQQLVHDRKNRDRDATRSAVDDAVRSMSHFILEGVTFLAKIDALEKARTTLEGADSDDDAVRTQQNLIHSAEAEADKVIPSIFGATNTVHADTILLAIRLGKKHPIVTAHAETREALKTWYIGLSNARPRNRDDAELEASERMLEGIGRARTKFEAACFDWMDKDF